MSDATPPPPTPEQPATPPAAPATPPAAGATPPAAPAAPAYAPAPVAGPKQSLSLTSFILGIAAFVLSFFYGIGFLPGIAAVIVGFIAKGKEAEAPKWMWLVGIIGGFVAIAIGIIVFIITVVVIGMIASNPGGFIRY